MSVLSNFSRLLPPPTFMRLPSVGVDISDTSLKFMQFVPHYGRTTSYDIASWGDIDIPSGALERGQVHDVGELSTILKEVRRQTDTQFVRISLPEERAYIFETNIKPNTPQSEIRSQLEFRLEEHVPIAPRDAFFDYDITADSQNKGLTVSVVVYARETIMNYYEACAKADMTPIAFEVEAQAIARSSLPVGMSGTHMVVDFGKTRTGVGIVHNGILLYTSTIDIGGGELTKALRKVLGDISNEELNTIKNKQGLIPKQSDRTAYEAILTVLSGIKDEIAARLRYWHSREQGTNLRRIESIVLCGGSCNLRGVTEYFTETLGVPTHRADVWRNISLRSGIPPMARRFSYGYATAIGLALEHSV